MTPATRSLRTRERGEPYHPHLVDLADGNNTVAGDATNDNTTALPPGLTLGQTRSRSASTMRSTQGRSTDPRPSCSPLQQLGQLDRWQRDCHASARYFYAADLDLDANNSTVWGLDYRAFVPSGGPAVPISDTDSNIDDVDGALSPSREININNRFPGDVLSVTARCHSEFLQRLYRSVHRHPHAVRFWLAFRLSDRDPQIGFSTDAPVGVTKSISGLGIRRLLVE